MNVTSTTKTQLADAIRLLAEKCPNAEGETLLSDIYIMLHPETGELAFYDDDDRIIAHAIVESLKSDKHITDIAESIIPVLQEVLETQRPLIDSLNICRPYSFLLIDEDHETLADIYIVDDDTILLSGGIMEDLDEDLDNFFQTLMAD